MVEFVVQRQKLADLIILCRQLLAMQVMLQRHQLLGGDAGGNAPHDGTFHRLTDKAPVGHSFGGNFHHEGTALRQDLHQPGFSQFDKGFAHRLA
ncbi:hypothetical protein D3C76_1335140 [compost metagenome]